VPLTGLLSSTLRVLDMDPKLLEAINLMLERADAEGERNPNTRVTVNGAEWKIGALIADNRITITVKLRSVNEEAFQ
jgi:hypothetical protein